MTSYTYVDTPNSNLVCCICHAPFTDPTTTKTCLHTFCHDCIIEAVKHSPQCPVDRSPLSPQSLLPANPIVKHLVDELIVQCPHQSLGCTHTCQRQLLASHLKTTCQHVPIPCSEPDCSQLVLRKDLGNHSETCLHCSLDCDGCGAGIKFGDLKSHNEVCPSRTTTCPSCSSSLPRSQYDAHRSSCPLSTTSCPHSSYGCPWTGPRHLLSSSHIPSCPYESIKGFLTLHSTLSSSLTTENNLLRQRVLALEGIVGSMAREIRICKAVLGPWYRAEDMYSSSSSSPSTSHTFTTPNSGTASTFNASPPHAGPSAPRRNSSPTDALPDSSSSLAPHPLDAFDAFYPSSMDQDTLSQYFPPSSSGLSIVSDPHNPGLNGLGDIPAHAHSPGRRNGYGHGYSHANTRTQHTPRHVTPPTPIAPLNLNTTLEGSLSSLHESISVLSTSLDSLARRNEIALTNESMRINEDMAALRYGMHGVRVQVHRIMMDRNAQVSGRMGELPIPPPFPPLAQALHPPMLSPTFPPGPVSFPSPAGTKL